MWAAGAVAAMSSITFPAVSALVSQSADPDKQGEPPFSSSSSSLSPLCPLHPLFPSLTSIGQRLILDRSSAAAASDWRRVSTNALHNLTRRCGAGDDNGHQRAVQWPGPRPLRVRLLPLQRGAEQHGPHPGRLQHPAPEQPHRGKHALSPSVLDWLQFRWRFKVGDHIETRTHTVYLSDMYYFPENKRIDSLLFYTLVAFQAVLI